VLVVDDEPGLRQMLHILLTRQGYDVVTAPGFRNGLEAISGAPQPFPVVLTDLVMPDGSGLDIVQAARARSGTTEVIVMTAHSSVDAAVDAMRRGAYDFVQKPFVPSEIAALVAKALEKSSLVAENVRLRAQVGDRTEQQMLGHSAAMRKVSELVSKVAGSKTTVLVTGESGTGKERVARALHDRSERASAPFLVVNCGALPEALMESELFGHAKGSFTGATSRHGGIFRDANGGTVFLDEVGELAPAVQVKLLRVLQERKVRPVGSSAEEPVDVRVISATNRSIEDEVQAGRFRQDLYYRLNVIRIELPPLRERREDVPELAQRFIARFAAEMGKDVRALTPDALRALDGYAFPGNVRELENMMERAVALAGAPVIGLGDLPAVVSGLAAAPGTQLFELPPEGCNLDDVLGEVERRLLVQALERSGGVRTRSAKLLGVTFRSLRYRLAKYGLDVSGDGDDDDGPPSGSLLQKVEGPQSLRPWRPANRSFCREFTDGATSATLLSIGGSDARPFFVPPRVHARRAHDRGGADRHSVRPRARRLPEVHRRREEQRRLGDLPVHPRGGRELPRRDDALSRRVRVRLVLPVHRPVRLEVPRLAGRFASRSRQLAGAVDRRRQRAVRLQGERRHGGADGGRRDADRGRSHLAEPARRALVRRAGGRRSRR
jgi:two-component system response regulator PilR (NtrC family)